MTICRKLPNLTPNSDPIILKTISSKVESYFVFIWISIEETERAIWLFVHRSPEAFFDEISNKTGHLSDVKTDENDFNRGGQALLLQRSLYFVSYARFQTSK